MTWTTEQQAENRAAWTAALRSGNYRQGRYRLRIGDKFCCLGVACDLAVKAGVIDGYSPGSGWLPTQVRDWLGLTAALGSLRPAAPYGRWGTVTNLNDDVGYTFGQIADLIDDGALQTQEDS